MKNKFKKLFKSFSVKVTILFCIIMLICASIWTSVIFINMRNNAISNMINDERSFIEKSERNIENIQEVCNMAIQVVSELDSIMDYIHSVKNGKDLDTQDKIDFYNNDLASIYNITNVNPYLHTIRLFVNTDSISENKPCLYKMERLKNLSWSGDRDDNKWNMDYADSVYPDSVGNNHLAGLTQTIYDDDGSELCIIEVATEMSLLFPEMFSSDGEEFGCFIDDDENIHLNDNVEISEELANELKNFVRKSQNENKVFTAEFDGESIVLSTTRIERFSGTYVHYVDATPSISSYYNAQKGYLYIVILSFLISLILMFVITTKMFKRFNLIRDAIRKIEAGQTDLRIKLSGSDEITDMGKQLNSMLDRLQMLNVENTTRQLIVKNTEIKAMQNQINAHFMYNVLESIKMMAEIEGQYEISDAVTSLGQMFRYSVKWTSGKVEMIEEIEHIKNYLSLMNIRLEHSISLGLSVSDELLHHQIPKMSLQPIVENAVLHGVSELDNDATIYLKAYVENNILYIEISDTGKGMDPEELSSLREKLKGEIKLDESTTHGLALKNVQNRIKMYYGDDYGIQVYSDKNKYTKVVLTIPYKNGDVK